MFLKLPWNKYKNSTDEELLADFSSNRDPEVLGELYSRYMHLVYGVCLKYLKEREESMDAVMQIFEKLLTEVPRHSISNFRSWLHVVTRNYCLMQIRSRKSDEVRMADWINDTDIFMENDQEMHPLDSDTFNDDKALEDCIEKLKKEQKDCIRQFYFENRCYTEIAAILGMDEKKVKSHLQNGKRNLKICLETKK